MSNIVFVFLLPSFAQHAHDVYIDIMLSQHILFNKGYSARWTDRLKGDPIGRSGGRLVDRSANRADGLASGTVSRVGRAGVWFGQASRSSGMLDGDYFGAGLLGLGLKP